MKVLVDDTNLTNIANSIRNKNGSSNTYKPNQMSTAIDEIPTGGDTFIVPNGMKFAYSNLLELPQMDFSEVTDMQRMFSNAKDESFSNDYVINSTNATDFSYMFYQCNYLYTSPNIDMSNATNLTYMFGSAREIRNLPAYNIPKVTEMNRMFNGGAPNLTDESLNNLLAMCISATSYTGTKTLLYLSLSQAKAEACQNLSNWDAFVAAGWSTGY